MNYTLEIAKNFKKQFKRLSKADGDLVYEVLGKLLNCEELDAKYRDHALTGNLSGTRECHVKPDLLLFYQRRESVLVLAALAVGSHSELF